MDKSSFDSLKYDRSRPQICHGVMIIFHFASKIIILVEIEKYKSPFRLGATLLMPSLWYVDAFFMVCIWYVLAQKKRPSAQDRPLMIYVIDFFAAIEDEAKQRFMSDLHQICFLKKTSQHLKPKSPIINFQPSSLPIHVQINLRVHFSCIFCA